MKEILSCSYLCFALQSYDFSNYANLVFGKVSHFSTVFCGITVFSASSSLQFFLLFCIAHLVQNPRFHRRKAIIPGRRDLIPSRAGALLSKEILTFKARECLASGGGGVLGFIRLNIRLSIRLSTP